jgi:hypothetical protein
VGEVVLVEGRKLNEGNKGERIRLTGIICINEYMKQNN